MAFKTLLLHSDDSARCAERTRVAIDLAQRHAAHLIGLYAIDTWTLPASASLAVEHPLVVEEQRRLHDNQALARERFEEAARRAGLSAEWRVAEGEITAAFRLHARYADLVVLGQTDPDQMVPLVPDDFPELICLSAGRPVLVVPYAGEFPVLGEVVLVAWNASREATRAATDALPLLQQARQVHILAVNPGPGQGAEPGADIAWYLARHGVNPQVIVSRAEGEDAGNEILSRAADLGADLIVMGAYGHARFTEIVLGGVSRTLLQSMTVPVLMAH